MPKSRIPSPARSQGAPVTPRRNPSRGTRSVGSPARSTASGRLSTIVDKVIEENRQSNALSPLDKTFLSDNTDIDMPRRKSWWKKVDNSRDVIEVLESEKPANPVNVLEEFDLEFSSQEKRDYTLEMPESSGSESISTIVIPQRRLFTQKENVPAKFNHIIANRESSTKQNTTLPEDKVPDTGPKNLFKMSSKRQKPAFPAALLTSPDKTMDKTKELAAEVKGQARNLFGNRLQPKKKNENMFADFIVSESDDEIPDIQPKLFAFHKPDQIRRVSTTSSKGMRDPSPTSITTEMELDDWKLLPSSTMVDHQIAVHLTPARKTRLSKLSEAKESTNADSTKQSNKSAASKNKSSTSPKLNKSKTKTPLKSPLNKSKQSSKSVTSKNKSLTTTSLREQDKTTTGNVLDKSKKNSTLNKSNRGTRKSKDKSELEIPDNHLKETSNIKNRTRVINKTKDTMAIDIQELIDEPQENGEANNLKETSIIKNRTRVLNKTKEASIVIDNQELIDEVQDGTITNNLKETNDVESRNRIINKTKDTSKVVDNQALNTEVEDNIGVTNEINEGNIFPEQQDDEAIALTYEDDIEELAQENNIDISTKSKTKNATHKSKAMDDLEKQLASIVGGENKDDDEMEVDATDCGTNIEDLQEMGNRISVSEHDKTDNKLNENLQVEGKSNDEQDIEKQNESQENNDEKEHDKMDVEVEHNEIQEALKEIEQEEEEEEKDDEEEIEEEIHEEEEEHNESLDINEEQNQSQEEEQNEDEEESEEIEQESEEENEEIEQESEEEEQEDNESQEIDEEQNESHEQEEVQNESQAQEEEQNESQEIDEEQNESQEVDQIQNISQEEEAENQNESPEVDAEQNTSHEQEEVEQDESQDIEDEQQDGQNDTQQVDNEQSDSEGIDNEGQNDSEGIDNEGQNDSEGIDNEGQNDSEGIDNEGQNDSEVIDEENASQENEHEQSQDEIDQPDPNVTHETTGRNRKKRYTKSPEAILKNTTREMESFTAKGRNTSIRKTLLKNFTIRHSLASNRESTGLDDGTKTSSIEGSGWDSHRTTRKTMRQTFGKDFTPRKSLRTLVMEKSAKRQTLVNEANLKLHQANSSELPDVMDMDYDENVEPTESDHDASRQLRQTTLENYLEKLNVKMMERKQKIEEEVQNSLKSNLLRTDMPDFQIRSKPAIKRANLKPQSAPKLKRRKPTIFADENLPQELLDDLRYKPPKRFKPNNASWITNRLYKFLESKLESKYDYKARVRAEKFVELLYNFVRDIRRLPVAPATAILDLKIEMARLDIVNTHHDFYHFFGDYLPTEVRVKVIPSLINGIPLPRDVFGPILTT